MNLNRNNKENGSSTNAYFKHERNGYKKEHNEPEYKPQKEYREYGQEDDLIAWLLSLLWFWR